MTKAKAKKKLPPNAGKGRVKGVPNRVTQDVRKAVGVLAERNVGRMERWLDRIAKKDPDRAYDLLLRTFEYHIPKIGRMELTGANGEPLPVQVIRFSDPDTEQLASQGIPAAGMASVGTGMPPRRPGGSPPVG